MALDEPDGDDQTEMIDDLQFCIKNDLSQRIGRVSIRLGFIGFVIDSEFPFEDDLRPSSGCSSCGGSCSI